MLIINTLYLVFSRKNAIFAYKIQKWNYIIISSYGYTRRHTHHVRFHQDSQGSSSWLFQQRLSPGQIREQALN